jgi:hypothetical protein
MLSWIEAAVGLGRPEPEVDQDLFHDLRLWKIFPSFHSFHFTSNPVFSFLREVPL